MAKMEDRLDKLEARLDEINNQMMDPAVLSDRRTMAKLGREANELTPIVDTYNEYKKTRDSLTKPKSFRRIMTRKSAKWQ